MHSDSQLCSVTELQSRLGDQHLKTIDASWYMPAQARDTKQEFRQQHIPGAAFFHIDEVCDLASDLPHMLPSPDVFSAAVGSLGVENSSDIVVYDSAGLFSAARVWWMFKAFGHEKVRVLNGGLPAWLAQGGAVNSAEEKPTASKYTAAFAAGMVADKQLLIDNINSQGLLVLDARSTERFNGQAPEPRKGLSSGHIPRSISLPFDQLVNAGELKPRSELAQILENSGVDKDSELVTSCGSGVTAAIITLALVEAGFGFHRLYDGSWAEWASADDTLIIGANP